MGKSLMPLTKINHPILILYHFSLNRASILSGKPFSHCASCTLSFSAAITFCLVHYFLTLFCICLLLKIKKESCQTCGISPYSHTLFFAFRAHLIHPNQPLSRGFFTQESTLCFPSQYYSSSSPYKYSISLSFKFFKHLLQLFKFL